MKNPDLLRSPRSSSLQRTFMYASFLETFACLPVGRGALHLGLFDQPLRNLLVCITDEPHRAERRAHREKTEGGVTSDLQRELPRAKHPLQIDISPQRRKGIQFFSCR